MSVIFNTVSTAPLKHIV